MKNKNSLFECNNCGAELGLTGQSHLTNTPEGEQEWTCNATRAKPKAEQSKR
jgi:hypothetical protein